MLQLMVINMRALCVILAGICASPAGAALLIYEGFDYEAGSSLDGKVVDGWRVWETHNDNGANVVANEGLSFADAGYGGYVTSGRAGVVSGVAASNGYSTASLNVSNFYPGSPAEPTTFYYSFLVKREAGAIGFNGNGTRPQSPYGAYVAGFHGGDETEWTLDAYNQPTNTFPTVSTGIEATLGETFFVVMRWRISGDWEHTVDLAINPSFDAEPETWDATVSFQRSISFSIWRLDVAQGDNIGIYDEMRLATTWEDVLPTAIPEPSACGLVFAGASAWWATRRRGKTREGARLV